MCKKVILFLLICSVLSTLSAVHISASDYEEHWAEPEITVLYEGGIISGYTDGSFRPDSDIMRAEFITVINKALLLTETADITFPDVPADAWYAGEVKKAAAAGYIAGDDHGMLNPDQPVTRAQACTMISKVMKLNPGAQLTFSDNSSIPGWAVPYIASVKDAGIITGYPDNTFRAGQSITRAEACVIIFAVLTGGQSAGDITAEYTETTTESAETDGAAAEVYEPAETTAETHTSRRTSGGTYEDDTETDTADQQPEYDAETEYAEDETEETTVSSETVEETETAETHGKELSSDFPPLTD